MKSKTTHIEFPVFLNYIVHVEVTSDLSKSMSKYPLTEAARKDGYDDAKACAIHEVDEPFSFVFLPYNASVGDIAHESWHVVRRIMEFCGMELDHECVSYHLGFLVDGIHRFMYGRKHASRKKSGRSNHQHGRQQLPEVNG